MKSRIVSSFLPMDLVCTIKVCALTIAMLTTGSVAVASTSRNLIVNGDGESGVCTQTWYELNTVPGWTVVEGSPSVVCYTLLDGAPTPSASSAGKGFIADGPFGDSALSQTVDVASAREAIDKGGVTFELSGWLGGWSDGWGQGVVTATFLDESGKSLGTPALLSGGSAAARNNTTEFLAVTPAAGKVPVGTRSIVVLLQFFNASDNEGYADNLSLTLSTPVTEQVLTRPESTVPHFDHVFVVMEENTGGAKMISEIVSANQNKSTPIAPFISSLMMQGTLLTNISATTHPSDPNYRAIASGEIYSDSNTYPLNDPATNLADRLEAEGLTWKEYLQGMGTPCNVNNVTGDTQYDQLFSGDDAPFATFQDIYTDPARCAAHIVSTTQLTADDGGTETAPIHYPVAKPEPPALPASPLPNFAWIGADDYDEGEASGNGTPASVSAQDAWLDATLTPLLKSKAWTQERSLLILTWDESYDKGPNTIATLLVGSRNLVREGYSSNVNYNHYSITRTIGEALHVPPMTSNDEYAQPINDAFTNSCETKTVAFSTSTPTVVQGARAVFSYVTPAAQYSVTNWVGIYPVDQTSLSGSTQWGYITNATGTENELNAGIDPDTATPALAQKTAGTPGTATTISDAPANGAISFDTSTLAAGNYKAYYLADNGYNALAGPVYFTVLPTPQ